MKNLLLIVLVLIETLGGNKVLATVKIPEVDFMTRILANNLTGNRMSPRPTSQTGEISNSLIPNHVTSDQDNLLPSQTASQIKFKFYLLERVNNLLFPEFTIANLETSTTATSQETLPSQTEKLLTKPKKKAHYPKIDRSSLIVNSPNNRASSKQLRLVNPAPETKQITSSFGWRIRPFSGQRQFHKGIDYGAPLGSPVVAAGNGIVTKVVSGCADFRNLSCGQQFGNRIEIDHGNGAIATYAHLLNNSIKITEGTKVWKNQEIAQVGSSGWSSGAHLDFRLKINGEYQNPTKYVK